MLVRMVDDVLAKLVLLAGSHADPEGSAAEALSVFRDAIPYAAASVSVWNPLAERHESLVHVGYDERVLNHLDTWFVDQDQAYRYMRQTNPFPLSWRTAPGHYRDGYSAQEVFIPAGFDEGVTACLFTPDGRYTGSIHISTDNRGHPSDEALDLLGRSQGVLAGLVDMMRTPTHVAATLDQAGHAAMVTPDGRVIRLPGRDPGPELHEGAALVELVADALRARRLFSKFRWRDDSHRWYLVHTHLIGSGVVVTAAPAPLPRGVTERELDVLTLLIEGCSNARIAARLFVSTKTVAKHLEHVLEKLGCQSRTSAAVVAVGEGLVQLQHTSPQLEVVRLQGVKAS